MLPTQFETIACSGPAAHVLCVTLSRPEAGNALNTKMGEELRDVFTHYATHPHDLRCVIFTGAGDKIFCGGGDLKQRHGMDNDTWLAQHRIFEQFYWALIDFPIPVIAAVNGHAFGGGLEMILATDFAYAVPGARFALTETKIGIMPGGGGTQTLARAIGPRRAKEIIFTGKPFTAAEAHEWGIINRIVEPGALMDTCLETAKVIAANAPLAIKQVKKAMHHGLQTDLTRGLWLEIEAYNRLVFTEDRREGVAAYNEKRPPRFTGR